MAAAITGWGGGMPIVASGGWIPAFAGMTVWAAVMVINGGGYGRVGGRAGCCVRRLDPAFAGMTIWGAGMAIGNGYKDGGYGLVGHKAGRRK